jgi:tRNA A22 N-methylase
MIQIDGPTRRVYIKFSSEEQMKEVYMSTGGQLEYRHENGEISQVNIAGMGTKRIRKACLPPEVKEVIIKECM